MSRNIKRCSVLALKQFVPRPRKPISFTMFLAKLCMRSLQACRTRHPCSQRRTSRPQLPECAVSFHRSRWAMKEVTEREDGEVVSSLWLLFEAAAAASAENSERRHGYGDRFQSLVLGGLTGLVTNTWNLFRWKNNPNFGSHDSWHRAAWWRSG